MANKKKRVDILSVYIEALSNDFEAPSFLDLINMMNGVEYFQAGKLYEFKSLNTELDNCNIGFIETTQIKDIPPIKNKQTKALSQVPINTETEGLVYANIFLFDSRLNVLIYEINRNGCFIQAYKDILEKKWEELHVGQKIKITMAAVCRRDEYVRMLGMRNYRKLKLQVCRPSEVLSAIRQQEQSLSKSLLEYQLRAAEQNNVNIISFEQKCMSMSINRDGLQAGFVQEFVGIVKNLCDIGQRENIKTLTVQGYTSDPETEGQKSTAINLLADVFDEYFSIPDVQVQSSLQVTERRSSIESLYNRVQNELNSIIR